MSVEQFLTTLLLVEMFVPKKFFSNSWLYFLVTTSFVLLEMQTGDGIAYDMFGKFSGINDAFFPQREEATLQVYPKAERNL